MNLPNAEVAAPFHRARSYGQGASDLDIAFAGGRAEAVTALLDQCLCDDSGAPYGPATIWRWSIGERLQALLAVCLATSGSLLEVQARCVRCGESMDIPLDLHLFLGAAAAPSFRWHTGGEDIELRLPQGEDLRRWQRDGIPAARELITTLALTAIDPRILADDETLGAIEAAFEDHDPLSALHLQAACPECGHDNDIDCDLEALLLAGFARLQAKLIDEVAQLASHFHWSEAQILALPSWRRAEYLRRLDAGAWM